METAALEQKLGELELEHKLRAATGKPQEDLLATARTLEMRARQTGVPDFIALALMRRGDILLAMERYAEAAEVLQEAHAALTGLREHNMGVQILAKQAAAFGMQADWSATTDICERGIELVEQYRYKATADYTQSAYLRSRIDLYKWGVRAAYELDDYELMLERAELSKSRSTLRHQMRNTEVPKDIVHLEQEFRRVCAQIDRARAHGKVPQKLVAERQTLWDLLSIQRYREVTGADLPVFSVGGVQSVLDADEAVIYYYWLDRYNLLIATIDRERVEPELRTITPEQREALEEDARSILKLQEQSKKLDKLLKAWSLLLPEVSWLEGKQRLIISPHQVLHPLPFHALLWKGAFLIQRFAVTYIPNLSSLLIPYSPASRQRVLAIGIRDYAVPGYSVRSLPSAELQASGVAELYEARHVPVVSLLGKEAQEATLQQLARTGELARFSCFHITTHGENIPGDTPMESRLYLHDSVLDGLDIAGWQIGVDLVVLSACCSGQRSIQGRGMDELPGDELFGLQAAFFAAGGRRLVSAQWPVDGNASLPIMTTFHRYLLEDNPPEVALQLAVNDFYTTKAGVNMRRAYYWAPFFIAAMGRPAS